VTVQGRIDCPFFAAGVCDGGILDGDCSCHPSRFDAVPSTAVRIRYCLDLFCPACGAIRTVLVERRGKQYRVPGGIPDCQVCFRPLSMRSSP
jgi:hypothetical protein